MTSVITNETFETKMKTRIKESIGDLITDEELSRLINNSVKELFLDPREMPSTGYNKQYKVPLIHEIVKECLDANVKAMVNSYIKENSDVVEKHISTVFSEGIGEAILKALAMKFQGDMIMMESNIINRLRNNTY